MKSITILILAGILLASGCKKKETTPVTSPAVMPAAYFFPLKVGNYWVYQKIETPGASPLYDTVQIIGDTIIGAFTYYEISVNGIVNAGNFEAVNGGLYADSAGYIVQPGNYIFPIGIKANDTLWRDSLNAGFFKMQIAVNMDTVINVLAGNFNCEQMIDYLYYPPSSPPPAPNSNPRPAYSYFAKNVGLIYCTNYFENQSTSINMQLVSYKIN